MSLAKIPLAGVIGSPIAHSKSPKLHGHWLKHHDINGFYIPMDVNSDHLESVLRTLPKAGFVGVNVTLPHKEAVLQIADQVSDHAQKIGAANTLTFRPDGTIHADNTDGYGFIENLKSGAPDWNPAQGPAAILGAGGASRAVIVSLLDVGVPEILLSNRTGARAEQLKEEFGSRIKTMPWTDAADMIADVSLLVNTTALGMTGKSPLAIPLDRLNAKTTVTDLVYTPLETGLLKSAKAIGCTTVDGLGMLLQQGVPGFERWFGVRPAVDDALRAAVLA